MTLSTPPYNFETDGNQNELKKIESASGGGKSDFASTCTPKNGSNIAEFFRGRSVFITGFTGFVGSAVVEKLLRSCSDLHKIYVLIRPKKGCQAQARLDNLLNSPLFDSVRAVKDVDLLGKVVAVGGDMTLPGLGLSPSDVALVSSQVSVVIHSAATVRFEDPLKDAMKINVEGTNWVLELAQKMSKLSSFVHISTAYANCDRDEVEESIYPIDFDPLTLIQMANSMPDDLINFITPKLMGRKPNTYTLTKHLAEKLVSNLAQEKNLPICIVRPAIVTASHKEPFPGWVDNLNGLSGILVGSNSGYIRCGLVNNSAIGDLIPLDHVTNLVISAAWATGTSKNRNLVNQPKNQSSAQMSSLPVYNCCSGTENPIRWREIRKYSQAAAWKYPFKMTFWYPQTLTTMSVPLRNLGALFFHRLPAGLGDLALRCVGKPPRIVRTYNKIDAAINTANFFVLQGWKFGTDNTRSLLLNQMSPEDQESFNFDMTRVDWVDYFDNYVWGLRRFVLKEEDSSLQMSRKRFKKLYIMHRGLQTVVSLFFICLFGFILSRIFTL